MFLNISRILISITHQFYTNTGLVVIVPNIMKNLYKTFQNQLIIPKNEKKSVDIPKDENKSVDNLGIIEQIADKKEDNSPKYEL